MRKIDVTQIVDPLIQQPFTGLSLDFLQEGNKQMMFAICQNIIKSHGLTYNVSVPYLISATSNTGFTCDGVVFFNDEIYIMRENFASLTYATIDTTPDATADPLLFTDSINRNVHNNRYLEFTNTLSGSLFAIADIINITGHQVITTITVGSGGSASAFHNSWGQSVAVKFRKNIDGLVSLEGIATKATTSSGVIFTLPVGYKPTTQKYIACYLAQAGAIVTEFLVINTNGDVNLNYSPSSANTYLYLDGINFYLL